MKTLTHQTPNYFPRGPEPRAQTIDPYLTKLLIPLALVATLYGAALWYVATMPSRVSAAQGTQNHLELSLSGAYTGNLSLGQNELNVTQAGPSSFTLASAESAVVPFKLSFRGDAAEASRNSAFFLTGATDDLGLTVAGVPYTLQSGTVTVTPEGRTVYASFVNPQGQPLELSGRFTTY